MTKVKICGITNIEDAITAIELGADAIGFIIFKGSRRYVTPQQVRQITKNLPPFVTKVGVFVNEDKTSVLEILSYANLDLAQLHGNESPDCCKYIGKNRVIKVFRFKSKEETDEVLKFEKVASAILLDTFSSKTYGGTGKKFDWEIAEKVKMLSALPTILSGGLNIANVKEAVEKVKPYGIDVCSGVEKKPGIKEKTLIKEFIRIGKCKN